MQQHTVNQRRFLLENEIKFSGMNRTARSTNTVNLPPNHFFYSFVAVGVGAS